MIMYLSVLPLATMLAAGVAVANQVELHSTYESLRQAVSQKDAAAVKKLAPETHALALKAAEAPAPAAEAEKADHQKAITFAKDVAGYAEYSVYAMAAQAPAEMQLELVPALQEMNPKSKYLGLAFPYYFAALNATGAAAKIPAVAEKALPHLPQNEDLLSILMEQGLAANQVARAAIYGERILASLKGKARPEEVPAADWEKKKAQILMRAYWTCGVAHATKNEYVRANEDLRAALPMVQDNKAMLGPALFHLGVANYWIGKQTLNAARVREGADFSRKASAIAGPYQQQAWSNTHLMEKEAAAMLSGRR
jgi:hypothetical protein